MHDSATGSLRDFDHPYQKSSKGILEQDHFSLLQINNSHEFEDFMDARNALMYDEGAPIPTEDENLNFGYRTNNGALLQTNQAD